jgi:hypothetical protein
MHRRRSILFSLGTFYAGRSVPSMRGHKIQQIALRMPVKCHAMHPTDTLRSHCLIRVRTGNSSICSMIDCKRLQYFREPRNCTCAFHDFHPFYSLQTQGRTLFSFNFNPSLGFVVMIPAGTTSSDLSIISNSNAPTNAAAKHLNSAFAKFCPIQLRGPCKKVITA